MKTTGREFFYSVPGLMVPKYIVPDEFPDKLSKLVKGIPQVTGALELFIIQELDMKSFVSELEELYILLRDIYAQRLEAESARILRLTEVNEGALCRELLTPFITNVRTLAIDIQLAQNKTDDVVYHNRSHLESCNDVVSSMGIIDTLVRDGDFKKAYDIAKSVDELQDSRYLMPLISAITSQKQTASIELVREIRNFYRERSDRLTMRSDKSGVLKKILVVDDMPEILTVVSSILRDHYQVLAFKESKDALKAIEGTHKPDAFLLDIDMPKLDGFKLAEKIRKMQNFTETPIMFLTANSTMDNLIKSRRFTPTTFIVKPVNKDIILSRLSALLATS